MREIKFRAWDKYHQEFVNPHAYVNIYNPSADPKYASVVPDRGITVMQYTGFKDRHGVEIYEGDIITTDMHGNHEVVFYEGCFVVDFDRDTGDTEWLSMHHEATEVIGNIHENPELLNEKDT